MNCNSQAFGKPPRDHAKPRFFAATRHNNIAMHAALVGTCVPAAETADSVPLGEFRFSRWQNKSQGVFGGFRDIPKTFRRSGASNRCSVFGGILKRLPEIFVFLAV